MPDYPRSTHHTVTPTRPVSDYLKRTALANHPNAVAVTVVAIGQVLLADGSVVYALIAEPGTPVEAAQGVITALAKELRAEGDAP